MRLFLKKFLSLSLILTLSIPAFSAVSVSDGSAFVSKAEFAVDMNNMSSRMAQLENSLDAKIDSLVSSYLSRNGIWNGEKQSLENTTIYNASVGTSSFGSALANSQYTFNTITVNSNISKSGLAFVVINSLSSATSGWTYEAKNSANDVYTHGGGSLLIECLVNATIQSSTTVGTVAGNMVTLVTGSKNTSAGYYTGTYNVNKYIAWPYAKYIASFFVNKGDKVTSRLVMYADFRSYTSSWKTWGNSGTCNMTISSLIVY